MRISVVLTTYNQPAWLERTLWGYAGQTLPGFELVVADDGSTAETAAVVERLREQAGLQIVHVWHEDRGFRKCEILNRAILASAGDYLVFSDADCVPRADFLEAHRRLAEPGRYLSGGCLRLSPALSERVGVEEIRSGQAFRVDWLRAQGWRPGKHALRLAPPRGGALLDAVTPTRRTWNGHNASTWREAIVAANGFDAEMGYGGLDRAMGERLRNLGLRGKQVRYRAVCLHLHHERPYRDAETLRRNREIRARIRRLGETRARAGIAELDGAAHGARRDG